MAQKLDVSPTRGVLLELRRELDRISNGHELLDRKRLALMRNLMERLDEAEDVQRRVREAFRDAREATRWARMRVGTGRLEDVGRQPTADVEVRLSSRNLMGVRVPVVDLDISPRDLPYGPADTSAAVDEARMRWLEVVRMLAELAEAVTTVWRLATELRKTQRRVNALESIVIPRYEETVDSIESVLEEEEREDILRARKVKEMRQR